MAYSGGFITGCNSPGVGVSKATYTGTFDATMESVDKHDHSSGKGKQIPTGGLADNSVTNAKIASNAVTADKINAGAITKNKLAAQTASYSSDVTTFTTTIPSPGFGAPEDLTGSSVGITSTGRPVMLRFIPRASFPDSSSTIGFTAGVDQIVAACVFIYRDGTLIGNKTFNVVRSTYLPISSLDFEDFDATAGAHTYTFKIGVDNTGTSPSVTVAQFRVRAYEQ